MHLKSRKSGGGYQVISYKDIEYKNVEGRPLRMDLHLPAEAGGKVPLVFYIHGGGWSTVTKEDATNLRSFISKGYAMVALDYRYSTEAIFPAQIEDVKAALRWLRAHASEFNIDPDRIVAWGHSAGAHLCALLALTAKNRLFDVGENLEFSSDVLAAGCISPPTDLVLLEQLDSAKEMIRALLGGSTEERQALAALASPLSHVKEPAPPLLFVHGDRDDVVPLEQSRKMHEALTAQGRSSRLVVQPGVDHANYNHPEMVRVLLEFFGSILKVS